MPDPAEYTKDDNPPYAYYAYYLYANLVVLNAFRRSAKWLVLSQLTHNTLGTAA